MTAFVVQRCRGMRTSGAPAAPLMLLCCGLPRRCCLECLDKLAWWSNMSCTLVYKHALACIPQASSAAPSTPAPHLPPAPFHVSLLGCSGMDAMARGLRNAARLIEEGRLDGLRRERYSSWVDSQLGRCRHTLHFQVANQVVPVGVRWCLCSCSVCTCWGHPCGSPCTA